MTEPIIYYFLENYDLQEIEIVSTILADGRWEITFKRVGTDEGGRYPE